MRVTIRTALPAAIVAITALAAGCGSSSSGGVQGAPTPSTPASSASPGLTPTPSHSPLPPATTTPTPSPSPSSDIPANHHDFGYMKSVDHVSGTPYLQFDRAIFLTGDAANQAAAAHGGETPVPNDYYIVNDNPLIHTYVISPAVVLVEAQVLQGESYTGHGKVGPLSDLETWIEQHPAQLEAVPFRLHFDAQDRVDRITEQFVP